MACEGIVCGTGGWDGPLPGDPDNNSILSAFGVADGVRLNWTLPLTNSHAISYIKIYRGITGLFVNSVHIATAGGDSYLDPIPVDEFRTYFYWIKFVSINGTELNEIGPASAMPVNSFYELAAKLSGKIDNSFLAGELRDHLDLIDVNSANIAAEVQNRLSENQAFANVLAAVQADVDGAITLVQSEITERSSADSALVDSVNALAVGLDGNAAAIIDEQIARISADGAMAADIQTLFTTVDGVNATIHEVETTKVGYSVLSSTKAVYDGDGVLEVYPALAYPAEDFPEYAINRKRIIDKNGVTEWNAIPANASRQVEWVVGLPLASAVKSVVVAGPDGYAGLEQAFLAQQDLNDGFKAMYTAKVDVNGVVGGFGLYNDGQFVDALFDVDNFAVGKSTASIKPFIIDTSGPEPIISLNGQVYIGNRTAEAVATQLAQTQVKSICFQRAVNRPATPTGGSYISPTPAGWSDGIPAGTLPVWMSTRIFTSDALSPQQAGWTTPEKVGELGAGTKAQFSVDGATSWHDTPSTNDYYMRTGTSTDGGATWNYAGAVKIKGETGAQGNQGIQGNPGTNGVRGSRSFYVSGQTVWNSTLATTTASADGGPILNDVVTMYGTGFSQTRFWNGTAWTVITVVIDGSLLVTGSVGTAALSANSVTADKIDSRGLSIKDASGNVILAAGSPLAAGNITPSSGWLNSNVSIAANGSLSGGGGGQVTIGGLGYTGDLNATYGANSSNLQAGVGGNQLSNSLITNDGTGWTNYVSAGKTLVTFGVNTPGNNGCPVPYYAMTLSYNGPIDGDYSSSIHTAAASNPQFIPVTPGQRVEAQALVEVFRAKARLEINFVDANGNNVGGYSMVTAGVGSVTGDTAWGKTATDFVKLWGFATAPAGAVKCYIEIRTQRTSTAADTVLYVAMPYLGYASAQQAEPTPWHPGSPTSTRTLGYNGTLDANTTTIDGSGNIQGVASGAGTQVDNARTVIGQNLIPNSDQKTLTAVSGWNPNGATFAQFALSKDVWPSGDQSYVFKGLANSLAILQTNIVAGGDFAVAVDSYIAGPNDDAHRIPVVEGQKYCFSAYVANHRCYADLWVQFIDVNQNAFSAVACDAGGTRTDANTNSLSGFVRKNVTFTAPAGTVKCLPFIRKYNTISGNTDSWTWILMPQFEAINSGASGPSPYQSGSSYGALSTIDQITPGNASTYIANAAIQTAQIANAAITNAKIGTAAIQAANIADAAITSAKIGTLEVQSANIANLTVGTNKISDSAVTDTVLGTWTTVSGYVSSYDSPTYTLDLSHDASVFIATQIDYAVFMTGGVSSVKLYVDGSLKRSINFDEYPAQRNLAITHAMTLAAGAHTIFVRVTGGSIENCGGYIFGMGVKK